MKKTMFVIIFLLLVAVSAAYTTVTGDYVVVLSDNKMEYLSVQLAKTGMTRDEYVDKYLDEHFEEDYQGYLIEQIDNFVYTHDSDPVLLYNIFNGCTDWDLSSIVETEDREQAKEDLLEMYHSKKDSYSSEQIDSFIACAKNIIV